MNNERLIDIGKEIGEFANIRGVGTIIVNPNGEILVGKEMLAKKNHKRQVGQLSIPLETVKPYERKNKNALLLASLTEIVTDDCIDVVRKGLREVTIDGPIYLEEGEVSGALSVFHWVLDSDEMPFIPSVPEEFGELRWMDPQQVMESEKLRPYAATLIKYAEVKGFLNGVEDREIPILSKYSPNQYSAVRELYPDVQ